MLIDFIQHFGSSFMTALGFAILYNIPRRTIAPAGLTGAIGWTIYFFNDLLKCPKCFSD